MSFAFRPLIASLLFCLAASSGLAQPAPLPTIDTKKAAEIEKKIDALIRQMTLTEKIGQMDLTARWDERPLADVAEDVRKGIIGNVMNFVLPDQVAVLQKAQKESRLKIPMLFALDAVNGYRTIFPLSLGQAATWNPQLIEAASYWTGFEAAATGMNMTFAPMVDMTRDPRWGRVHEGAGEDPFLASIVAAARVKGYQRGGVAASAKHFIGYGAVEAGRDYATAWIPTAQFHDVHVPPFQAAVDAGSLTVMSSFVALNGVPVSADKRILTDLLRKRMGFQGLVVTDFETISEMLDHGIAATPQEAVKKAIDAGVDLEMVSGLFKKYLPDEVKAGRVSMKQIDEAVRRVLRVKFYMGLFERRDVDPYGAKPYLETAEARQVARDIARQSLILLKNDGILPLKKEGGRVAVIGAFASDGNDKPWPDFGGAKDQKVETLVAALRRLTDGKVRIDYAKGVHDICGIAFAEKEEALALAKESDVIVAMLGEECEDIGEAASRTRLGLPGVQQKLLEELTATGKPVVLVLATGRPLVLSWADQHVAAILQSYHAGMEGRTAIAEVLLGDVNPSGRVVMSYPRTEGQIPVYYSMLPTGRPYKKGETLGTPLHGGDRYRSVWRDEKNEPLYAFGHGLSYTEFRYSDLNVLTPKVTPNGMVEVEVVVTNAGSRDGREVVQLYTHQKVASRSRPVRELKAFEPVEIKAGESRRLHFKVPVKSLGFHDDDGLYRVEPGPFDIFVGGSSNATLKGAFAMVMK